MRTSSLAQSRATPKDRKLEKPQLKSYGQEHDGIWMYTETSQAEREYHRQLAEYTTEQHDQVIRELMGERDAPPSDNDDDSQES